MQKVSIPITNFQFGEVSPSLLSRTDTAVYTASAQKVENFFLRSEGGVIKRAGLSHIYKFADITYNSAKKHQSRLLPFIFSDDEQYILSIESGKIRVFQIHPSTGVVTLIITTTSFAADGVSLPLTDDIIHECTFAQAGDVMFICHPTFKTIEVIRTALTTFIAEQFSFDTKSDGKRIYQPYYNFHSANVVLSPSDTSGSVTLTTSNFTATADPDGLSETASVSSGANLTLGGALTFGGGSSSRGYAEFGSEIGDAVNVDAARLVTITSVGNDSGFAFTVTGTNINMHAQTEAITGGNGATVTGTKFFRTVTQIASAGNTDGAVTAGVTNEVGVHYFDTGVTNNENDNYEQSLHVGITLLYHNSEILITSVQSGTQVTGTILDSLSVQLKVNPFKTIISSTTVEVTHVNHGMKVGDSVTLSECSAVGNISVSNLNGARAITGIIDDHHYTFTAGGAANASIDGGGYPKVTSAAPTTDWAEQSYSSLRGFPSAVTFHQNRLCFAGTLAQPDSIWMSKSAAYYNFDPGDADDSDSIHLTASIGEVQQIRHLVSNRDLQVFTASSEMYIPSFQDKPTTPTNVQIIRQTPFGCDHIRPQVLDGATVFVQSGGAIVREYLFTDTEEAYTAVSVSSLSSHLISTPIEMNTFYGAIDRSESYIFVINDAGNMAVFNSNRAEKRAGWVEFTSQGKFHSTVTIDDRVFANVAFPMGDGTTTITVTDYANIAVGTTLILTKADGTTVTFTSEASSGSSPSSSTGFRPNESNNTTADNIYTAINAHADFTVANPAANIVTVRQTDYSHLQSIVSSDTTRLATTNESNTKIVLCEFETGFNTDMSKTYTATSSNNGIFTVSSQFANGAVVDVISGSDYVGEFTVSGGNVDVSAVELLNSAEIGYKFDVNLKTNPIDTNTQAGPVSGKIRSLASVVVDLNTTLSVNVNNTNLVIRQVTDDMSVDRVAFTGPKEFRLMGYGRTPQVTISQSAPLSLQVNGLIAELVF